MEKRSLLNKYGIPISHLDFGYVKSCKDTKELERIVTILRSGEEGYYPDLTKCAEDKLTELKPQSKVLRTEERCLTKSSLSPKEWQEYRAPLIEWSTEIKSKDTTLSRIEESSENILEILQPPIRKGGKVLMQKDKKTSSPVTVGGVTMPPVAGTNYSEWDKYDADAEVLKIELEEERVKEHVERMNRINEEKSTNERNKEEDKSNVYEKLTPVEREKLSDDCRLRGNEYFKSKEYIQAIDQYTRCIQIRSTAAGYNNRAITNLKLCRYSNALSDCDECLRLEPTNLKALMRKAEACLGLDKKLDALQIYEQIVTIDPENAFACNSQKNLRNELGDVAPAHATRIEIVDKSPLKKSPPKLPPAEYDLVELVKPSKLVKSQLVKTMESLGKLTPLKNDDPKKASPKGRSKNSHFQETSPDIKLSLGDSNKSLRAGKCLIQEL